MVFVRYCLSEHYAEQFLFCRPLTKKYYRRNVSEIGFLFSRISTFMDWLCICLCTWCSVNDGNKKRLHKFCEKEKQRHFNNSLSSSPKKSGSIRDSRRPSHGLPKRYLWLITSNLAPCVRVCFERYVAWWGQNRVDFYSIRTSVGYHEEKCWRGWLSCATKSVLFLKNLANDLATMSGLSNCCFYLIFFSHLN